MNSTDFDTNKKNAARFAPVLYLKNVAGAIAFYKQAFDAKELRRWSNDDGSVHVAEMLLGDAMFPIDEEVARVAELSPETLAGNSVNLGVFVDDPDAVIERAIAAGALLINPTRDFDYGYRQGDIKDPFGHKWTFQKAI